MIAQWLCDVRGAFDISPAAFTPPPKVTSTVVHFVPRVLPANAPSFDAMEKLTAAAFGQTPAELAAAGLATNDYIDPTIGTGNP